jgi:hypothetical protein
MVEALPWPVWTTASATLAAVPVLMVGEMLELRRP